jgi:hypothetical protein
MQGDGDFWIVTKSVEKVACQRTRSLTQTLANYLIAKDLVLIRIQ